MFKKIILIWMLIFSSLFSSGDDFITTLPRKEKAYLDIEVTKVKTTVITPTEIDQTNKIITLKGIAIDPSESLLLGENPDIFDSLFSVNGRLTALKKLTKQTNLSYFIDTNKNEIKIHYTQLPEKTFIGVWNKTQKQLKTIYKIDVNDTSVFINNNRVFNVNFHGNVNINIPKNYNDVYVEIGKIHVENEPDDYEIFFSTSNINIGILNGSDSNPNFHGQLSFTTSNGILNNGKLKPEGKGKKLNADLILKIPKSVITNMISQKKNTIYTKGGDPKVEVQPHKISPQSIPRFNITLNLEDGINETLKNPPILNTKDLVGNYVNILLGDIAMDKRADKDEQFGGIHWGTFDNKNIQYKSFESVRLYHQSSSNNIINAQGYITNIYGSDDISSSSGSNFISQTKGNPLKGRLWIRIPNSEYSKIKAEDLYFKDSNTNFIAAITGKNPSHMHWNVVKSIPLIPIKVIADSVSGSLAVNFTSNYQIGTEIKFNTLGNIHSGNGAHISDRSGDPLVIPAGNQDIYINEALINKDGYTDLEIQGSSVRISFDSNGLMSLKLNKFSNNTSADIKIITKSNDIQTGYFDLRLNLYMNARFEVSASPLDFGTFSPGDLGITKSTDIWIQSQETNLKFNIFQSSQKVTLYHSELGSDSLEVNNLNIPDNPSDPYKRTLTGTIQNIPSNIRAGEYQGAITVTVIIE